MNPIHILLLEPTGEVRLLGELPKASLVPRVGEFLVLPVLGKNSEVIVTREVFVERIVHDLFNQTTKIFCIQTSMIEVTSVIAPVIPEAKNTVTTSPPSPQEYGHINTPADPVFDIQKALELEQVILLNQSRLQDLEKELEEKKKLGRLRLQEFDRKQAELKRQRQKQEEERISKPYTTPSSEIPKLP